MGIEKIPSKVLADEINQVWNWMKEDKFYMDIERVPLSAINEAWQRNDLAGKRLVIVP
jgi:hypothetical protein